MCRNIRLIIAFDLLVAFIFPDFTVLSHHFDDNDYDDSIFFPGDYYYPPKPPPSVDYKEGSKCTLANGSPGTCTKFWDCHADVPHLRRCGSDRYTQFICCPQAEQEQEITENPLDTIFVPLKPVDKGQQTTKGPNKPTNTPAPPPQIEEQTAAEENTATLIPPSLLEEEGDRVIHTTVFNGFPALKGEFPYMAALGYTNTEVGEAPFKYTCGGSLISVRLVLTAAHCVRNKDGVVPVHVLLGTIHLVKRDPNAQLIDIDRIDSHEQYKIGSFVHDLAVITLKLDVTVTSDVVPIHLPTLSLESTILQNKEILTIGYGVTETGELSNALVTTPSLSIISREVCNETYSNIRQLENGILDTMICVRDDNSTRSSDACEGDSGGPLIMLEKNKKNTDVLIGVTAFGVPCGFGTPGVYTAVHPYLSWIDQFIWKKSN